MLNKRVLIFSLAYHPVIGGAEVAVKEITDRINDLEFDMVTMRFDKTHSKFERIGNINVYRIGGDLGYLSKILFIFQAAIFAARRNYDAYWSIMTYMLFPTSLLHLFGNRTPYALNLQDGDPFTHVFSRLRILFFRPLLSYGFKHANKIQTISNFLAQWAKQMGYKGEVDVIPNGVDIDRFRIQDSRFTNKNKVVLITTSRLVKKNGIDDVIDAMKLLSDNMEFQILGTGPLESELKNHSRILNLESRIKFLGHIAQAEIPQYLHNADIFIRPSLSEGQGISFIEAMAAGLPVIATPVGGIPDFLKDSETGLFCEVNNPESIAKQVNKLLSDKLLREKIIINARKMVEEKYDWSLITEEMKVKVFGKV